MRNTVAKRLRSEVGTHEHVKKNSSSALMYKELKREHMEHTQHPNFKETKPSTPLQRLSFLKTLGKWRNWAKSKH